MAASFEQLDFWQLEDQYSEDERMVRDTVRQFVQDRVLPTIEHHFRDGTFPLPLVKEMAELGLLGANLEGYGCAGLGAVAYGLIMQELERGDSGVRSFASVQGALVMIRSTPSIGRAEDPWLPRMAMGGAIGCFGPDGAGCGGSTRRAKTAPSRRAARMC
jgi:glutaryl-CoA dehydrogenase